jgi:hypothetical protein
MYQYGQSDLETREGSVFANFAYYFGSFGYEEQKFFWARSKNYALILDNLDGKDSEIKSLLSRAQRSAGDYGGWRDHGCSGRPCLKFATTRNLILTE